MTFAAWYDSTIAPQVEESLQPLPKVVHEQIRKSSREAMAACWNAALEEAAQAVSNGRRDGDYLQPADIRRFQVEAHDL